ncbi:MAG TPA: chemotaxis protein CheC [Opitutus sp.]|nr:chemotaxis protein CheC [Opitutus sp.]
MELTLSQKDAVTELINIGYGRAAGALSELTGYQIALEVPEVTMHDINAIAPMLESRINRDVASVNQVFSGPVSGNALLLIDQASALVLSRLLGDEQTVSGDFDANAKEIITEVGNILLNACLGVFGNLLRIQVTFSVPRLHVENVTRVFRKVITESDEALSHGLMIHTRFHVKAGNVTGYLVIVLGIASLDRLLLELTNWEQRQIQ